MTISRGSGDKTHVWRESYSRVSKDLLRSSQATNRSRIKTLGLHSLRHDARILDVGAGDGNLFTTLRNAGFRQIWGLEYQAELAALHPDRSRIVIASAADIPFASGSMEAVIVMDVLHHLPGAQLPRCISEMRRVLEPGGVLFVCEPAGTLFRKILTAMLMSPLSRISRFSRDKRAMVEAERETLDPWLEAERGIPAQIAAGGFSIDFFERCWLHHYGRFRAV